jgi:hypothetical protein
MKLLLILTFIIVLICGCASQYPFLIKGYETGVLLSTNIGNPMFQWGNGVREIYTDGTQKEKQKYIFHNTDNLQDANGTLKEFIYKGILDSVASFVYREYNITPGVRIYFTTYGAGTYMKSVFNLDVQYDLKKSKVIAFQNFELKIKRCDQQGISFEIINELEEIPVFNK